MKRAAYLIFGASLVMIALYSWRPKWASQPVVKTLQTPAESIGDGARPSAKAPSVHTDKSTQAPEIDSDGELSKELRDLILSGDVNARDAQGRSALMIASFRRDQEAFGALIKAGADLNLVDHSGQDALMNALNGGSETLALRLIELGADPKRIDLSGQSALSYAVGTGHLPVIHELLKRGANPNLLANSAGYTMAMDLAHEGQLEALKLFVAHGARVDGADKEGNTLTHHAVLSGNAQVVEFVIGSGASPDTPNKEGLTPLDLAQKYELTQIVTLLSRP